MPKITRHDDRVARLLALGFQLIETRTTKATALRKPAHIPGVLRVYYVTKGTGYLRVGQERYSLSQALPDAQVERLESRFLPTIAEPAPRKKVF